MFKIIFFLIGLLASCCVLATPTAIGNLETLLGGIQTMQARFVQVAKGNEGGVSRQTSGKMALQRPGKFRWDVRKPDQELIVADGTYLWIYNVALEQATKEKIDYRREGSPAMLLSGSMQDIQRDFTVRQLKDNGSKQAFELKPKAEQGAFQWLILTFVDRRLVGMQFSDNLGQKSMITFGNIQMNQEINPRLFQFKPPKGVDVVTNEEN